MDGVDRGAAGTGSLTWQEQPKPRADWHAAVGVVDVEVTAWTASGRLAGVEDRAADVGQHSQATTHEPAFAFIDEQADASLPNDANPITARAIKGRQK